MSNVPSYPILEPNLQIAFYDRLKSLRELYLYDALSKTVRELDIPILDKELANYVPSQHLQKVASFGLRGEVFFPVPYVIEINPRLLGYYRLLFGFSQKEFYHKGPFGTFKRLEEKGQISSRSKANLNALCLSLIGTALKLVDGIDDLSLSVIHDLQMLTLGPQLRGSQNTELGKFATNRTFSLIKNLVLPYIKESTERTIVLENDSKRTVIIEFSSDPDIRITERLATGIRPLVSIEIKGGLDASNIHNRLGEAEKSHQKAKSKGFFEFWTIIRVNIDYDIAKQASPTTSYFFHLDRIHDSNDGEYAQFRDLLGSLLSIRIEDTL
jgi:hypothetical protein